MLGLLMGSSNGTFLVRASGASPDPFLAVYKPASGESPLWDFPTGSLYKREVAAYRLSRALGWPLVPPTVARPQGPHGVGALQLLIDADPDTHYFNLIDPEPQTWSTVAAFDFLINNADRKAGHCLTDAQGNCWLIDHGLTFHVEPKLRTVIWEFSGQALPDTARDDMARVARQLRRSEIELSDFLSKEEIEALLGRFERALAPDWRFPAPTSGWSVPWPPV
jgi:hypothetical protein